MSGFILLIVSVALILASSYFIAAFFQSKRAENTFLFWILVAASQVILSFEVLSILKSINTTSFLITNIIVFAGLFFIWNLKNNPVLQSGWVVALITKIKDALKRDKILFYLALFFIFSAVASLFLAIYAPVNQWDCYQVTRAAYWIQHQTLAHFETSSVRQVMFPVNSELFTLLPMMFLRKEIFLQVSQYLAGFAGIFVIYNFLSYLKFSTRRILWTIFVFASLPAIIILFSSTQDHLVLAFFLFASLYLFIYGVFENEKKSLIFSALALGISIGTKSSVFFFLPALALAYLLISIKKHGKYFYRPFIPYTLFFTAAFLIFGAYNYILNYIDFGNFLGLKSYIYEHTYKSKSISSFSANFIRYIYSMVDFTGFEWANCLSFPVYLTRILLFTILGLNLTDGLTHDDMHNNFILVNANIHENYAVLGPLGFLVLLPLVVLSVYKYIHSESKRTFLMGICGLVFAVFLLTISAIMGYEHWNNRYIATAAVLGSPVLALSYYSGTKFNFKKLFIFAICIFCFVKISLFNAQRPILPVKGLSLLTSPKDEIRYGMGIYNNIFRDPVEYLNIVAENSSKIGLIYPGNFWQYQFFAKNPYWKLYPLNSELLDDKKLKNLDFLVIYGDEQEIYSLNQSENFLKTIKIDLKNISKHFKLVYSAETDFNREKYKYSNIGTNFKFYVFKKNSSEKLE